MGVKELKNYGTDLELYKLARFLYKVNVPIISDQDYDVLHNKIKMEDPESFLLKQTYDDDEYPIEIFNKYGIKIKDSVLAEFNAPKICDNEKYASIKSRINDFRSNSVRPVEDYYEAWKWFQPRINEDIILSLKVNGINTRSFVTETEKINGDSVYSLLCSSTRAREGEGWDITKNLSRKFPKCIKLNNTLQGEISDTKVVYGEAYVTKSSLTYLRQKYYMHDTWKTPRSTALSMLRVDIQPEDYVHLKLKVFKISDLADTLSETLSKARSAGFDTVPWTLVRAGEIPEDFIQFQQWIKDKLNEFYVVSRDFDIESDGVVAELDNQVKFVLEGSEHQYNTGNIALKIEQWASVGYTATVKRIIVEPRKDRFSVRAEIEPTLLSNGNVATMVNCFNPDIIIKEGIKAGSRIRFEYKSDANINLIYNRG